MNGVNVDDNIDVSVVYCGMVVVSAVIIFIVVDLAVTVVDGFAVFIVDADGFLLLLLLWWVDATAVINIIDVVAVDDGGGGGDIVFVGVVVDIEIDVDVVYDDENGFCCCCCR